VLGREFHYTARGLLDSAIPISINFSLESLRIRPEAGSYHLGIPDIRQPVVGIWNFDPQSHINI